MIGGLVGIVLYGVIIAVSLATGTPDQGNGALILLALMILLTIVMVIAGVVLVIFQRTRQFAIGLLISIAIGVFVSGGVCVAVASTAG